MTNAVSAKRTGRSRFRKGCVVLALLFAAGLHVHAQKSKKQKEAPILTRIEFLFDASQSMYGRWQSGMKIDVAKRFMSEMLDSLRYLENVELAIRIYGHQKPFPPQDCDDTRLEVPFEKGNAMRIKQLLNTLKPRGTTPIARSLEACAGDFPSSPSRNIIILVTDGAEECGGDPCAVSQALQRKGIVLKPFVIGMGLDESLKKAFDCVGNYYDAANETMFKSALSMVISQALNNTTLQVNLLDVHERPTETNVNMTFYSELDGTVKYNFIHTMNSRGNPDTLTVDPLHTYRIVVHTIPPASKDSVRLSPGTHTIVGIDAPQGALTLKLEGVNDYKKLQCVVRRAGEWQTLNVQEFGSTEKYIVGKYDLEILTLPRLSFPGIDIGQSKTTTLQIPQPGIVSFLSNGAGYGSIYTVDANEMTWVCNLDENLNKESVVLQPGNYRVIYRARNARESVYTVDKTFKVVSGVSNAVTLN